MQLLLRCVWMRFQSSTRLHCNWNPRGASSSRKRNIFRFFLCVNYSFVPSGRMYERKIPISSTFSLKSLPALLLILVQGVTELPEELPEYKVNVGRLCRISISKKDSAFVKKLLSMNIDNDWMEGLFHGSSEESPVDWFSVLEGKKYSPQTLSVSTWRRTSPNPPLSVTIRSIYSPSSVNQTAKILRNTFWSRKLYGRRERCVNSFHRDPLSHLDRVIIIARGKHTVCLNNSTGDILS